MWVRSKVPHAWKAAAVAAAAIGGTYPVWKGEFNPRVLLTKSLSQTVSNSKSDTYTSHSDDRLMHVQADKVKQWEVSGHTEAGWSQVNHPQMSDVRKENQDTFVVLAPFSKHSSLPNLGEIDSDDDEAVGEAARDMMFVGVFDGHGAAGRTISHMVRDNIARSTLDMVEDHALVRDTTYGEDAENVVPAMVHRTRLQILQSAFLAAERRMEQDPTRKGYRNSGSTAAVTWILNSDVYTAWAGDSRAVVGRRTKGPAGLRYEAVNLTSDHTPARIDEWKRVEAAGSRVAQGYVWAPPHFRYGLQMTRAVGDCDHSEYGVIAFPEVTYTRLGPEDDFIVLASDGVWDFLTSQQVCDFVGHRLAEGQTTDDVAAELVREAERRWRRETNRVDDISAVVLRVRDNQVEKSVYKSQPQPVSLVGKDGKLAPFLSANDLHVR